jgi:hypothetical protein
VCNLYSLTKGQAVIQDWFRARHDRGAICRCFPASSLTQMAPIVRVGADGERELVMARWGMPGPPEYGGAPVTNIRNLSGPHWRGSQVRLGKMGGWGQGIITHTCKMHDDKLRKKCTTGLECPNVGRAP